MITLYCDGSYKNGRCGIAIAAAFRSGLSVEGHRIIPLSISGTGIFNPVVTMEESGYHILASAFPGKSNFAAETAALALAIETAHHLLLVSRGVCSSATIRSDSRNAIMEVLSGDSPRFAGTCFLRRILDRYPIVVLKTDARRKEQGSLIADRWAGKVRKDLAREKGGPSL